MDDNKPITLDVATSIDDAKSATFYSDKAIYNSCGIAKSTLDGWVHQKKAPPFFKPSRQRLWPITKFWQWVESQTHYPSEQTPTPVQDAPTPRRGRPVKRPSAEGIHDRCRRIASQGVK